MKRAAIIFAKTKDTATKLDFLRTRAFQFALQRLVMFATVFIASFLILWKFDFFTGSILSNISHDYPKLVWRVFLIFNLYMVAHPLVKNIAESYNKSIHSWTSTLLLIAYAICITFFADKSSIKDIHSIKLIHFVWLIPSLSIPLFTKSIGIFLTLKLSPIQSKKLTWSFLSLIGYTAILISGVAIFRETVIYQNKFDMEDWKVSLPITVIALSVILSAFFNVYGWYTFRKIKFSNLMSSVPLLVVLPIFGSVLIWVIKGTFEANFNKTPELWFLLSCIVTFVGTLVFIVFFAKEIKSAMVMNTIFSTVILAVWIGVFTFVYYFGIVNKSYVVVDIAAATSLGLFILMAVYDRTTKSNLLQEMVFTWMILIMMLLVVLFSVAGKAHLFDEMLKLWPIDMKALIPVMLVACPAIYFLISISKIVWAQTRITRGVKIEKAIKKRKVQEILSELKELGVKYE